MTALSQGQEWKTVRFEVLESIESLPSLSLVVTEFLALARRDFFTAKDFERVISKDQALVARLLKVANSGLYGRSRTITSIPEAVVLIGVDHLKKIVYAVSSEGLTKRRLENYDYHPEEGFWLHAMGVGYATKVLVEASPAVHCTVRRGSFPDCCTMWASWSSTASCPTGDRATSPGATRCGPLAWTTPNWRNTS